MKFDFSTVLDRHNQDALAVDSLTPESRPAAPKDGFDVIPMWIADMCFPTAPAVQEAMLARLQHPIYGYFQPSQAYFDSITAWQRRRNGVTGLEPRHIGYANGVLGGLVSALNVLCSRGDSVLLHSPTYTGFTRSLNDNGYHIVHSPLTPDENGIWRMDFDDMEKKIVEHRIHTAVFCSPHNPTGRVWEPWEIEGAMEIFRKHDVFVISDEIWSDLILSGHKHIPSQSVSEDAKNRTVALYSPSKAFNLAGLVGSYSIVYNPWLRDRMNRAAELCHFNAQNVLSMHALMGAYSPEGEEWLEELRQVLTENVDFAMGYFAQHFPEITLRRPQGTYLLFPDCSAWCKRHEKTIEEVEQACWNVGVAVQDGRLFHGECHLRINLALPRTLLEEALGRLKQYVFVD